MVMILQVIVLMFTCTPVLQSLGIARMSSCPYFVLSVLRRLTISREPREIKPMKMIGLGFDDHGLRSHAALKSAIACSRLGEYQ
jgi:hypothetical protein